MIDYIIKSYEILRNIIGILEINDDYITNWFLCNTLLKFIYC